MVDHVDQAVGRTDQDIVPGLAGLGTLSFHLRRHNYTGES